MKFTLLICAGALALGPLRADSRLTNVSVRSTAGGGADTLIVGFTISGTGAKSVLLRGVGPTLAAFNVTGAVNDSELRLFNSGGVSIADNDNWGASATIAAAATAVGAFTLPANSLDAALLTTVAAGNYSAHVTAKNTTGIALVEAYDTDPLTATAQFTNVSARSLSGTGASLLTVGFAISGDTSKTILIRAIGPTLAGFGVTGTIANPQLKLFNSRGTELAANDDWLATAGWGLAFNAVGAFPLANNSRDAALLVRLAPGSYTAQASGANNTSGVALIEVYDVPNPPVSSYVLQPIDRSTGTPPVSNPGSTDISQVTTFPVPQTQARPVYPLALRMAGIAGEAVVDFIVNVEGRVVNAYAIRATDILFAESAVAAVSQWTFLPGRVAGQPVATHMQVPIIFTLN